MGSDDGALNVDDLEGNREVDLDRLEAQLMRSAKLGGRIDSNTRRKTQLLMANPFSLMMGDLADDRGAHGRRSNQSHSSSSSEKDLPLKFQLKTLSAKEHESPPQHDNDMPLT